MEGAREAGKPELLGKGESSLEAVGNEAQDSTGKKSGQARSSPPLFLRAARLVECQQGAPEAASPPLEGSRGPISGLGL